jgi:hypothetical protein
MARVQSVPISATYKSNDEKRVHALRFGRQCIQFIGDCNYRQLADRLSAWQFPGKRIQKQYAARAVALLHQAVGKGFKDAAHMKEDKDLDALRDREDFKWLLVELKIGPDK